MNFDTIKNLQADMTLSLGGDCRPAESMRRNKIRFFSSPFDWMMRYKLDVIYDVLKNKGKDFFADFEENKEEGNSHKFRYMVSRSTGMVSMHHFRKNISAEDAYFLFRYTMDKRFKELDRLLTDAKSVCFISSRKTSTDEIKSFLQNIMTLYGFEKVYYINIHSDQNEEKIIETNYDNITIYECFFNDVHPNGKVPKRNPKFWKGNIEYWDKILEKVHLNKDFVNKYRKQKMFNDLFPSDFKSFVKVKCIDAKCRIFRLLKIKVA